MVFLEASLYKLAMPAENEILSYFEMCQRKGTSLKRGMSSRLHGRHSVVLKSVPPALSTVLRGPHLLTVSVAVAGIVAPMTYVIMPVLTHIAAGWLCEQPSKQSGWNAARGRIDR